MHNTYNTLNILWLKNVIILNYNGIQIINIYQKIYIDTLKADKNR